MGENKRRARELIVIALVVLAIVALWYALVSRPT